MSSNGPSRIRYHVHACEGSDVSSERESNEGFEDPAEACDNQLASQATQITSWSALDGEDTSGSNDNYDARYSQYERGNSNDCRSSGGSKTNKNKINAKRKAKSTEFKNKDCTAQRKKARFDHTGTKEESMHPIRLEPP
jgi:hypothetical protein